MARVLVTAGPTVEALDPVRFLSNRSSGRMGYAVARALLARGHEVVLVSGPVSLRAPAGVKHVGVESAREMLQACREHWDNCDALYAVAAVADYRPKRAARHKLKRHEGEGQVIELTPNPDIVRTLARSKQERLVVGFAKLCAVTKACGPLSRPFSPVQSSSMMWTRPLPGTDRHHS